VKKIIVAIISVLGGILAAFWLGFRVKPKRFPAFPEPTPEPDCVELPEDLPKPVARFFKKTVGASVPIIRSAVLTGSVKLRFFGLPFPGRFRITHIAGQGYRHYIEVTFFGYPVIKVNEWYLHGEARLELPFGVVENEPKINIAANLGLWAESLWLSSILITDPRVRWEPIDDNSARLVVPFGEDEDTFTARFYPSTGLLDRLEAQRYRDAKDAAKTGWLNEPLAWHSFHDVVIPHHASVTWTDQGTPWSEWTIEDVAYNVDVSEYIRASGL
jgi:hypothetical protein